MKSMVQQANHIVVFSGAGFSTESNIPDFRSEQGLYHQSFPYPAEVMLSHDFFFQNTECFYQFYRQHMLYPDAQVNQAHKAVAALERAGKLEAIITQNIDGLHQKAGNQKVLELHGSVHRNYCMKCHAFYDLHTILSSEGIPLCSRCGGIIKPDVVLYGEELDRKIMQRSIQALSDADLLIVAGTSLVVHPAAGLIQYYKGKDMILINHDSTSADQMATYISREDIGVALDFMNHEYQ